MRVRTRRSPEVNEQIDAQHVQRAGGRVNGSATFTGLTALADMLAGLDWPTLAESSGVGVWIGDPDDGDHAGAG